MSRPTSCAHAGLAMSKRVAMISVHSGFETAQLCVGSVVTRVRKPAPRSVRGAARVEIVEVLQFVLQPHDSGVLALNRESLLNFGDKAPDEVQPTSETETESGPSKVGSPP